MTRVFHKASSQCFEWLKNQQNVKEESLTDWLLYFISQQTDRIYYQSFTRNEEFHNGADWEWWVIRNKDKGFYAYRFLIQAKKLKRDRDNYPVIAYGNKNGLQIDLLVDAAKKRRAMPLYLYYTCGKPEIEQQVRNLPFIESWIIYWCKFCKNGAYLSTADRVKDIVFGSERRRIQDIYLLNHAFGLSICDILLEENDAAAFSMEAINDYYINHINDKASEMRDEHWMNGIRYDNQTAPQYLNFLVSQRRGQNINGFEDEVNIDWIEEEFSRELNGLDGVGIIDLRTEKRNER